MIFSYIVTLSQLVFRRAFGLTLEEVLCLITILYQIKSGIILVSFDIAKYFNVRI